MIPTESVIESVLRGEGLTHTGTWLLSRAFGEMRVYMVASLPRTHTPAGKRDRLMALAFALTKPKSIRVPNAYCHSENHS